MTGPDEAAELITGMVRKFVEESPLNRLGGPYGDEPAWGSPLVGFAAGDDPVFETFKLAVGPVHWTPEEIFRLTFPGLPFKRGELSVVSWVLPQTRLTKDSNRANDRIPSERWVRSRTFGEDLNTAIKVFLVNTFAVSGVGSVSPASSPEWKRYDKITGEFLSNWSERHIAHAAGLGTFGLCDGLITPAGKAVRLGSVVARIRITPSPRPYSSWHEYCPFLESGECGACISRCPAGAISERGHDKKKCSSYSRPFLTDIIRENYGFEGIGCGLCQTGVPCESGVPGKESFGNI